MKKLLVSSLLLVSCLYVANAQSVREAIDKESYTGEWIFTVDEVVLS